MKRQERQGKKKKKSVTMSLGQFLQSGKTEAEIKKCREDDSLRRDLKDLRKHYGTFPGPDEKCFKGAGIIAKYLEDSGIKTVGVICTALQYKENSESPKGILYVGFSPDLQKAITKEKQKGLIVEYLEDKSGRKAKIVTKVGKKLLETNKMNPGCAEKKIMTKFHELGMDLGSMALKAHPDNANAISLTSYMEFITKDSVYIKPCDSCKSIHKIHFPEKK